MRMREKFRQGIYGIGGDFKYVQDGVGELRIFEVPVPEEWLKHGPVAKATASRSSGMRKMVLNVPAGSTESPIPLEEAVPVQHVKLRGTDSIAGKSVQMIEGTNGLAGRLAVAEGLWEVKRGVKIDGGERRHVEVRAKRREAERKGPPKPMSF